jgi:hypothetical protein
MGDQIVATSARWGDRMWEVRVRVKVEDRAKVSVRVRVGLDLEG